MTQQEKEIVNLKLQSKMYSLLAIVIGATMVWGTMYFLITSLT